MLVGTVPLAIGWLTIGHTEHFPVWCATRFASGLAYGSAFTVLPVYLGEIASAEIRGQLTFIFTLMCKSGMLVAYALGPLLSVRHLSYVGLAPLVAFGSAFVWLPDSPYDLVARGRSAAARSTVRRLRGLRSEADPLVAAEMARIVAALSGSLPLCAAFAELYRNAAVRRNMWLMWNMSLVVAFSGSQVLLIYAQIVFESSAGDAPSTMVPSAATATVLLGAVQLPALVAASFAVDRCGRRPLVLVSVAGTMLCNCVCGGIFATRRLDWWTAARDGGSDPDAAAVLAMQWQWLIGTLIVYFLCYVIGICAVFSVFLGELFPMAVRPAASAVIMSVAALLATVALKLFQVVSDACGMDSMFAAFAVCGAVSLGYSWLGYSSGARDEGQESGGDSGDVAVIDGSSKKRVLMSK